MQYVELGIISKLKVIRFQLIADALDCRLKLLARKQSPVLL